VLPEAEALEPQRAQPELALRREQLCPAEHVDALAVPQVELERVEGAAGDRRRQAGPVLGVLEREEDAAPALVAAELGHLALDPERRQAREPVGDTAVEAGDGVDLLVPVEQRRDLHQGERR
jgi:hypothetical protein